MGITEMSEALTIFHHKHLQDALNVILVMEQNGLTIQDVKEHLKTAPSPIEKPQIRKSRRGFLRRTTKAQREAMKEQRGLMKQSCKSCDEKRRGKR